MGILLVAWSGRFYVRTDEGRGDLRDDGIAVTAQSSHSGGYPISQREKAGLSRPEFGVSAGEPLKGMPEVNTASALNAPFA